MKKLLYILLLIPFIANAGTTTSAKAIIGTIPTQREDGTPLAYKEIGFYNIYCGIRKGDYQQSTVIKKSPVKPADGKLTVRVLDIKSILQNGTNYCVETTVDTDGRESRYSNVATINYNVKSRPKPPAVTTTAITITGTR